MPYSIGKRLQVGELKPTMISIQLGDCFVKYPMGVLNDVPLQVGKFFIPYDFVVMKTKRTLKSPSL